MKTTIKITLISIVLSIAYTTALSAQNPLTIGIKAGLNLSDYAKDINNNDIKAGFNAGATVDYKLSRNFFLLSGIEVSSKGSRVKVRNTESVVKGGRYKEKWNPIYLQIPVHIGYLIQAQDDMAVVFHVGPYTSYGIAGKITKELQSTKQPHKEKTDAFGKDGLLKRWDFGMGVGVGFEFRKIGVNFGYDLGILNVSREHERSLKNNTAHVSFSYRFENL